ncbi:hypothetical protein [Desulfopila sp. IMCC35006]|nr:hypothetical protein [Desulfopila sp. IMCC35006]
MALVSVYEKEALPGDGMIWTWSKVPGSAFDVNDGAECHEEWKYATFRVV